MPPAYAVLSCGNAAYYPFLSGLVRNLRAITHCQLHIYDLGLTSGQREALKKLGATLECIPFDPATFDYNSSNNIRTTHKIDCIEHFLTTYQKNVIVLDADILLIEDVLEKLLPAGGQIIVTRRCDRERRPHILINGKINAGVLGFGHAVGKEFFAQWRSLCAVGEHTDQSALSAILDAWVDWKQLEISQQGPGYAVRLLDGNLYNDVTCRTGKILHFKNAGRRANKRLGYAVFATLQRRFPTLMKKLIKKNREYGWLVWKNKRQGEKTVWTAQ